MKNILVQILIDNPNSWMIPYGNRFVDELNKKRTAILRQTHEDITPGDILVLLSCEKIIKKEKRQLNKHNLVVHESALPKGKGWSPLTWQVLKGKNQIPVVLFEAEDSIDSGVIYERGIISLEGHELVSELREMQAQVTLQLIEAFLEKYPNNRGEPQTGQATFFPRRTPKDSELDPDRSLADQFDRLRVVDNERYPAFFDYRSHRYVLKIEKMKE